MTHDLTHATAPPKAPTPQTRRDADLLGVYRSRLHVMPGEVRSSITESDRPRGADLAALEGRARELRSFPPASEAQRMVMVSRLFMRWDGAAKIPEEQVKAYAQDLAHFPIWAIGRGISDIVAGHVLKSPEYRPSSLQVRAAVEARLKPIKEELALLDTVIGAKVVPDDAVLPSPERRKELANQVREMMHSAIKPIDPPPKPHPRLASRFDTERGYDPDKPVVASPELMGKLGVRA